MILPIVRIRSPQNLDMIIYCWIMIDPSTQKLIKLLKAITVPFANILFCKGLFKGRQVLFGEIAQLLAQSGRGLRI